MMLRINHMQGGPFSTLGCEAARLESDGMTIRLMVRTPGATFWIAALETNREMIRYCDGGRIDIEAVEQPENR